MADPIRTPSGLLSALRAVVGNADWPALRDALQVALEWRREVRSSPPQAWTREQAVEVLSRQPYTTSLFGALRLLTGAQPDKAPLGYSRRAEDDPVRIDQTLLLGFATSEVDEVRPGYVPPDEGALKANGELSELEKIKARESRRVSLRQSAVGLLGPNGALPYRWTEHAYRLANPDYRSKRDSSFLAWLNVLQRRQFGLLYRAWSDAQAVTAGDQPSHPHPVADRFRALAGVLLDGQRDRGSMDDRFKMAFAAPLSRRVRNPGPLASMLKVYFDAPVRIEEFAATWMEIPQDQRTCLGRRFTTLGEDSVAGIRVWDSSSRFRIVIGPLSLASYRTFLPNGENYVQLRELVTHYLGAEFEWDLVPILAQPEVPLGWLGNPGLVLGWTSWLGVRYDDVDADDLVLPMTPQLGGTPTGAAMVAR